MTALSDAHLALGSSKDTKVLIFEINQKKFQSIQAHKEPITFMTKVVTEERYFQQGEGSGLASPRQDSQKKPSTSSPSQGRRCALLVTCSKDNSISLWKYDYEMKTTPTNYQKLLGFQSPPVYVMDLQDQQCIIAGDSKGEITIWDYHKSKIVYACQGKH